MDNDDKDRFAKYDQSETKANVSKCDCWFWKIVEG